MLSNDGQQGVIVMTGVSPYGEDLRRQVLDEALKGERRVREVAESFEITQSLLRAWLKKHYEDNPADTRRHFIERESPNYKREPAEGEAEGGTGNDDEMAKRDRTSRVDPKVRRKILEEVAKGERTRAAIAAEHGLHGSTISYWEAHPQEGDPGYDSEKKPNFTPGRQKFVEALEQGKTVAEARTLAKISGTKSKKWHTAWKRSKILAKARATYAEKMKTDPVFNEQVRESMRAGKRRKRELAEAAQQELDLPEEVPTSTRTQVSGAAPSEPRSIVQSVASQTLPTSGLVRVSSHDLALGEVLEEAVGERNALREMVKILEREAKQKDEKLAAYRRRYGDIQQ